MLLRKRQTLYLVVIKYFRAQHLSYCTYKTLTTTLAAAVINMMSALIVQSWLMTRSTARQTRIPVTTQITSTETTAPTTSVYKTHPLIDYLPVSKTYRHTYTYRRAPFQRVTNFANGLKKEVRGNYFHKSTLVSSLQSTMCVMIEFLLVFMKSTKFVALEKRHPMVQRHRQTDIE